MSWPDTFSQYEEDLAIAECFKGRDKPGRFLDIGAWDPKTFSNTRALYELGWSGVMIEPSPTPMLSLLKEYGKEPRITLVQAAVAPTETIVAFEMSDDSVSTSDPASYAKWKDQTHFHGTVMVRTITWDQICLWYGGFDFVNIDAEGTSVDLFHEMLKAGARPQCCCVEHDGRLAELAAAATSQGIGYKMVYSNGTNALFAR